MYACKMSEILAPAEINTRILLEIHLEKTGKKEGRKEGREGEGRNKYLLNFHYLGVQLCSIIS